MDTINHNQQVGAPCKLTPETADRIYFAISKGATYELAANYAGISYNTFRNWMKKGEEQADNESGDEFYQFYKGVKACESDAACKWLEKIDEAAEDGNWQAAAWKLERRYPQSYGKTVQEIQGKEGGPIEYANLNTDERLERIATVLEQARARRATDTHSGDREGRADMETSAGPADASLPQQS